MEGLLQAAIAVGRPVRGEFTYAVPPELGPLLRVGQRVMVPFGRGRSLGFVLGVTARVEVAGLRLKPIEKLLDQTPALPADVLELLRFAAVHYRYPLGEAVRMALPPGLTQAQVVEQVEEEAEMFAQVEPGVDLSGFSRAPSQAAALSYLLAVGGQASVSEVDHAVPGARESLRRLSAKKLVRLFSQKVVDDRPERLPGARPDKLTPDQAVAVTGLIQALDAGAFAPFLLHGVTGSGKTEVYLQATEHALKGGKGSLILVPEIALTPQLVGRFRSRFGAQVAVLHSALRDKERLRAWQGLRDGTLRIAVGVRSAVFAPVASLGLIVVDEEHDPSFKQEEKLRYQARDLAVVRGKQLRATVVLGSATPSLETLENCRRGRYRLLKLHKRVEDRPLPEVELVDLRVARPRVAGDEEPSLLSPPLVEAMAGVLAKGRQVILFINRRGHSTFWVCQVCGQSVRCPDCDVALTHHLSLGRLVCHYCGTGRATPSHCPDCQGALLKLGAGTERVEAEVADRFPHARVARLDRDAVTSAESLTELLSGFARGEIDVLVGTQMVAKGHDFPGVVLVCVVMADTALTLPDFRASERTFQLLTQVAGRAGRGSEKGRVLVQTYNPDAQAVRHVLGHDYDAFAEQELRWRQALAYPPFTRMLAVRIDGAHPEQTAAVARQLAKRMARKLPPPSLGVRLLGPAPAPIARIKGRSRWQILLKGPTHALLAPLATELESALEDVPASVRVVVDVDPGAML